MAFTILARVGEDNPKSVLATTVLSYSISSVITGAVFFLMGACKIGSLVGFFPRHILIGCIGGVGWFLFATGLEVSARLDGNLEYNLVTLRKLVQLDTIFLWMIPLVLAIVLLVSQRWVKSSVFVPLYFLVIPTVFYFFVAAIPDLKLDRLRELGWVFAAPEAGKPWYDFYTLYGKLIPNVHYKAHIWLTVYRHQGGELASTDRNGTGHVCLDFLRRPPRPDQCSGSGVIYGERQPQCG